jgi:HSP20 family protein
MEGDKIMFSIQRHQPRFTDLWNRNVNTIFNDFTKDFGASNLVPRVDISDDAAQIYINAELPGLRQEDVKVTVSDGVLTIRGEKKHEEKKEDRNYYRIERRFGEFVRQFALPDNIKSDDIRAEFTNGVLEIMIPKAAPEKPQAREIPINGLQ